MNKETTATEAAAATNNHKGANQQYKRQHFENTTVAHCTAIKYVFIFLLTFCCINKT